MDIMHEIVVPVIVIGGLLGYVVIVVWAYISKYK